MLYGPAEINCMGVFITDMENIIFALNIPLNYIVRGLIHVNTNLYHDFVTSIYNEPYNQIKFRQVFSLK